MNYYTRPINNNKTIEQLVDEITQEEPVESYPHSQNNYRSNTPKYKRQINQEQTSEVVNSDPPGIDNIENTELQLSHINYESTDSESDTENAISNHLINVENYYEPLTNEQPFHSHIHEN